MRNHAAVRYSHTRLELRLMIQLDRRFRHIQDVQEAIDLFGHRKDINQPTCLIGIALVGAFKLKHGYSVSAIYYDPAVTLWNLAGSRQQSCVVCGVVHDNVVVIGDDFPFNVGHSTGYNSLCSNCEYDFLSYSGKRIKQDAPGVLTDDIPDGVDWEDEWAAQQKANQLTATTWLLMVLKRAVRDQE